MNLFSGNGGNLLQMALLHGLMGQGAAADPKITTMANPAPPTSPSVSPEFNNMPMVGPEGMAGPVGPAAYHPYLQPVNKPTGFMNLPILQALRGR